MRRSGCDGGGARPDGSRAGEGADPK